MTTDKEQCINLTDMTEDGSRVTAVVLGFETAGGDPWAQGRVSFHDVECRAIKICVHGTLLHTYVITQAHIA